LECIQRYAAHVDPEFGWVDTGVRRTGFVWIADGEIVRWTAYVLNVTSIRYLAPGETNVPVWWHPTVVVVPSNLDASNRDFATFNIGGASQVYQFLEDPELLSFACPDIEGTIQLAVRTGNIAAAFLLVPNQPVVFADDPARERMTEDVWKAYAEAHAYKEPARVGWIPVLAMAKSAMRGMDAVADFARRVLPSGELRRFAVAGCSKRGMASWWVGLLDSRVKAIMPCCIAIDMKVNMEHLAESMGSFPFALAEYQRRGLLRQREPLPDPVDFVDRLTMPKLVMTVSNDMFFPPDTVNLYFSRLQGPKTLFEVANMDHQGSLTMLNFIPAMVPFVRDVARRREAPVITWTIENVTGTITVTQVSRHRPVSVIAWSTRTCNGRRRDFRFWNMDGPEHCARCGGTLRAVADVPAQPGFDGPAVAATCLVPIAWIPAPAQETRPGTWRLALPPPADGWAAFYLHFVYAGEGGREPHQMTTEVSVVPQTYPFPGCGATPSPCADNELVLLDRRAPR